MNKDYFEKGDMYLDMYDAYGRNPIVFESAIKNYKKGLQFAPDDTLYHYRLGYAYHQRARINVQWGGHGSLPLGWESLKPEAVYEKIGLRDLKEPMLVAREKEGRV